MQKEGEVLRFIVLYSFLGANEVWIKKCTNKPKEENTNAF